MATSASTEQVRAQQPIGYANSRTKVELGERRRSTATKRRENSKNRLSRSVNNHLSDRRSHARQHEPIGGHRFLHKILANGAVVAVAVVVCRRLMLSALVVARVFGMAARRFVAASVGDGGLWGKAPRVARMAMEERSRTQRQHIRGGDDRCQPSVVRPPETHGFVQCNLSDHTQVGAMGSNRKLPTLAGWCGSSYGPFGEIARRRRWPTADIPRSCMVQKALHTITNPC